MKLAIILLILAVIIESVFLLRYVLYTYLLSAWLIEKNVPLPNKAESDKLMRKILRKLSKR